MLHNTHRYVFILQSYLKPQPESRPYADIKEIATLLQARVDSGQSYKLYRNETLVYRIRSIVIKDERYLVLLISCGDKNAADPCFENFNTGTVRNTEKSEDEGQSHAAHVIIDMESLVTDKPLNTFVLERVPGLSVKIVEMFLRHEIKAVFKKTYRDENNKNKSYTATINLDGHASHTIKEALQTGTLKHVSLVHHEECEDGHDEAEYIAEKERQVAMKIKPCITSDKAISAVTNIYERIRGVSADSYDTMIIRIKTAQGVTKQTAVDIANDSDILSQAFYHQEKIDGFTVALEASPMQIRDDVVAKMIGLIPIQNTIEEESNVEDLEYVE